MWAGIEPGIDDAVGVRLEFTADAGTALARHLVAGRTIELLASRWRQRGIVGVLRRPLECGQMLLQLRDARQRRVQSPDQRQQRQDEVILLRMAQIAEVDPGSHTELESSRS